MNPTVILVGADKGGVGKTTICRALLDFLARKNVVARAFDTEHPRGTLNRFFPTITEIIDLHNTSHQMKILDTLDTASVKVTVVDLKAGNLSGLLDTFERIGVLDAARAGQFDVALFHVVGPAVASLDEIGEIARYIKSMDYIVARNFINESAFFEWDTDTHKRYFAQIPSAAEIDIPKLNEMAYEQVDLAAAKYHDFVENRTAIGGEGDFSFVLRGYVRKWMSEIDAQFERLSFIQSLLRGGQLGSAAQPVSQPVQAAAQVERTFN